MGGACWLLQLLLLQVGGLICNEKKSNVSASAAYAGTDRSLGVLRLGRWGVSMGRCMDVCV